MYGFKQNVDLNIEEILKRATQEEIFNIILKDKIIPKELGGAMYVAPYRDDDSPGCYFEYIGNTLMFVDFTMYYHNLDCFNFIQRCLNCSFHEALTYIDKALELGISSGSMTLKEVKYEFTTSKPDFTPIKRDRHIYIARRNFRDIDGQYWWFRYEITKEQLIEDKVFPITTFRGTDRTGKEYTITPFDITYCYTEFDKSVKVYRPYAKEGAPRFITNCNQDCVFNESKLPLGGNTVVITKSYKDCRVLRNQGIINCVAFQNEGMIPSEEKLIKLFGNYNRIVVWFDNDQSGLGASIRVVERLKSIFPTKVIETVNLPTSYLDMGIKDPADMIDKKQKEDLINFINIKKLKD